MNLTRTATAAAAVVAALICAPAAVADPVDAAPPAPVAPPAVQAPEQPYSVIDVAALPLFAAAQWAPVLGHNASGGVLAGITACSANGVPAPADLDGRARAATPTYTAFLHPTGDAMGWSGNVSAAGYSGIAASSYALASYRRYLDSCRTAPPNPAQYHNAAVGTSVLDPTEAHALIETADAWMEVFAVATNDALVEVTFSHPKDVEITFPYDPAAVFGALKMADVGALARPAADPAAL